MPLTREDRDRIRRARDRRRRIQLSQYRRGIKPVDTYVYLALNAADGDPIEAINLILDAKGDRELPFPTRRKRK